MLRVEALGILQLGPVGPLGPTGHYMRLSRNVNSGNRETSKALTGRVPAVSTRNGQPNE